MGYRVADNAICSADPGEVTPALTGTYTITVPERLGMIAAARCGPLGLVAQTRGPRAGRRRRLGGAA